MDLAQLIPNYQPLPFPLPVWAMQVLLVLGFYLHALPMNVIFGGGFLAAALFFIGRSDRDGFAFKTAKALAIALPIMISFAITQGIVPLLFVQLLYGPAFYSASVIMAVPWISIVLVVLVSYYLSYITIYRVLKGEQSDATGSRAAAVLLVMAIGFSLVGYMFTNEMTLMLTPDKWLAMYQHNTHGLNLNSNEPQLIPRYLHFLVAAFAVAGMFIGCMGLYIKNKHPELATWQIKTSSKIFIAATVLQLPVGLWFLKSLPQPMAAAFMGGDPIITGIFIASMVLMLAALVCTSMSAASGSAGPFLAGVIANALLILTMCVNRHELRLLYLNPHVRPDAVPVNPQWDLLAIFLVSAVALIFYLVWLVRLVMGAFQTPAAAAAKEQVTV